MTRKLVRDFIPEIIRRRGEVPLTQMVHGEEHERYLHAKLREEVAEYNTEGGIEELADIYEVIYTFLGLEGFSEQEFQAVVRGKRIARGGFEHGIVLIQDQ